MDQDVSNRTAFQIGLHSFLGYSSGSQASPPRRGAFRVKASRARLMNEAESRKKKVTTKKVKTLPDDTIDSSLDAHQLTRLR